ncbi:ROK family protein [Streptosporangium carneum]|uniref:Sugar kinase n=1 Tax=Streptosporangium carneum TaxID=47481 RepID=A0A9W6MFF0_9ACTN|nr:ROK family protein [Streptosporangium carneum]GLK12010.1 sugar kinase [Streptosporangium carneum]
MSSFVVALDVGGTAMKGGLVTRSGEIALTRRRDTPRERGPAAVVQAIRSFIDDLAAAGGGLPAGVGLAVPGLVTPEAALYSANIGWRNVPAEDLVPLDVPVMLGHDVRTGGLAESVLGAGREISEFLFLPIGTGIAGAVVVHGEPYGGSAGWGGEIGHIPVFPDGEPCACGQIGCLETYASASAVSRRYSARASSPATAEQVAALTAAGDPVATGVWNDAVEALSLALATYTLLLDPAAIVLGGGLSEAGHLLSDPLAERLQKRLTFREAPPIRPAALGVNAGMLGAALLGWRAAGHPDAGSTWSLDVLKSPPVA